MQEHAEQETPRFLKLPHRFGAELPSLGDKTVDRQIPYVTKIRIGVGKCADSARGHPHLGELGSSSLSKRARTAND